MRGEQRWFWMTRDPDVYSPGCRSEFVVLWYNKSPKPYYSDVSQQWNQCGDPFGRHSCDEPFEEFCYSLFKRLTGLTVPVDRPIKVRFGATVVGSDKETQ